MKNVDSLNNGLNCIDDFTLLDEMSPQKYQKIIIPNQLAGLRLDVALARLLPEYSRSRLSNWIREGLVTVNDHVVTAKYNLVGGEHVLVTIQNSNDEMAYTPEHMDLDVVYEDDSLLVLNKPARLVVHPGAGNWHGTLLNGLLAYCPSLKNIPRAGIVHRLDKDTSGLMVVAKTLLAQTQLVQQLQARTVKRTYRAVADGLVPFDGKIETLIGRDPHNRLKMAVLPFGGKEAITHVKVLERYEDYSYIECSLETGRTHQIRVHMRAANHPLAGDPVYGNPRHKASDAVKKVVKALDRQALHAYRLQLMHPVSKKILEFEAPLPQDMYHLLSVLRLESGKDSALSHENNWLQTPSHVAEDDDWHEDAYDVDVIYTRE